MVMQRSVRNPFEKNEVVGITNYVDVAFQMVADMVPASTSGIESRSYNSSTRGGGGGGHTITSTTSTTNNNNNNLLRLGISWQANKNVLIKGRAGFDGIGMAAVFKSWWQVCFQDLQLSYRVII